ncbi:hypothetical protein [Urbifossiella limnaea]|uniref:DUF1579 domain-containing protein n=1 Tax=Urbifossiella limnaea TaxID=2528023 RepID=A0A517Y170_9BACT|nr:hypothetical protein [Urbifossiella limnaea]QDU23473.1 hypothetical protein ETAA1_54730 [Urbifossiella limnaea]
MTRLMTAGVVMVLALGTGASGQAPAPKAPAPHPAFEKLKGMAGTWVEADKDGKPTAKVVSVVRVIAGGSTVHETSFPGTDMEMVSVYHRDGADVVMTHYCMLGNQPRLKLDAKSPPNQLQFKFTGGTNLDVTKDMHMHDATYTFVDADHVEISGVAWVDGKPAPDHCGTMKLVRKK